MTPRTLNPAPDPIPTPPALIRELTPGDGTLPYPIRPCQGDVRLGRDVADVPTGDLL